MHAQNLRLIRTPVAAVSRPAFDVVSIHPMMPDDQTPTHISNPLHKGSFSAVNVTLKALMEVAYGVPDLRMMGGPGWTSTETFAVEARTGPDINQTLAELSQDDARKLKQTMLQVLLEDRFKLAIHTDTRQLPVYRLRAAKGGLKLAPTQAGNASAAKGGDSIVIAPGSNSLEILAYELSWRLGRPVLDQTGLEYHNALRLSFADDSAAAAGSGEPSVFSAVRDQLGLQLEPGKGPVPVLLIDHAEEPTGN
jgi:uncharacterized protein (TIGR03435 family)